MTEVYTNNFVKSTKKFVFLKNFSTNGFFSLKIAKILKNHKKKMKRQHLVARMAPIIEDDQRIRVLKDVK